MSQDEGGSRENRNEDIGWKFGTIVGDGKNKRIQCNLCGKEMGGGITRLKQHLAHQRGQVAPCERVSAEVKKDMMALLMGYKDTKRDKERRTRDLEEEIRNSARRGYDDDNDEDDRLIEIARQQSLMQHEFDYNRERYRRSAGANYNEGGSSRAPQMQRSATVREAGYRGGRDLTYEPASTPASRLRAVDIALEKDQGKKKQKKLTTGWFKEAKKAMTRAFGNWIIDNNQPFTVVESMYTNPLMDTIREVGKDVRAPSAYDIAEVYLPEECQEMKRYIESFANIWKERGVTIMCDGWTGPTGMHVINFLVYSVRGTVFHKSVDASEVMTKDTDYYFKLMKKVVDEISEEKVVQVVTDNEAAMKAAGKRLMIEYPHLYWTACAAHCLDLTLEDIAKKTNIHSVLVTAKKITQYLYNSNWVVNYMKKFTNGRELLRPGITRFATNFIALESIMRYKTALQDMFESSAWVGSRYGRSTDEKAREVRELLSKRPTPQVARCWDKAEEILKVQEPLVKVLRLVDGDVKPTMGFIYEAMERAKLALRENCPYWKNYWKIIDKRWNFQLHHELHAAGYFFNPQYIYGNNNIGNDMEVMLGVKNVIQRLERDIENQVRAYNQVFVYRDKRDSFASTLAKKATSQMDPAEWWLSFGDSTPELRRIAVMVLSQTTSASNCERNWSMWSLVHTKVRNRLKYKKLHMIVYLRYNMKLRQRHLQRRSREEIYSSFNPINLDYIFEGDDPLNPWLEESEQPVFDDEDANWLNLDDDVGNDDNNVPVDVQHDHNREIVQSPPFRYSISDRDTASPTALSPPSSDGDGDGDGDGGNEGLYGEYGSYSTRQSSAHNDDLGYSTIPNYGQHLQDSRTQQGTRTFQRRGNRKGKEPIVHHPSDSDSWHDRSHAGSNYSSATSHFESSNVPLYGAPIVPPYKTLGLPLPTSSNEEGSLPQGSDMHDNTFIFNDGTINYNYGNVHYHQLSYNSDEPKPNEPTNYAEPYHSGPTNYGYGDNTYPNESSWVGNAGTYFFEGEQGGTDGVQNNDDDHQPPRRSFWW